jgi:DegV family protein with EDD domain
MPKYVIVVESGADIPSHLAKHHGISIVPMHLTFGGKVFDDGELSAQDIFAHFDKTRELPQTSGSTPSDFSKVFDEIHEADPEAEIIHLAYSASTTCSYESALAASRGRSYVHHFDTKNVSAGQAVIVLGIAEYIAENLDVGLERLKEVIKDRIDRLRMTFMPCDLRYLRAGGRLSNASYLGAQLLRVRPLIEVLDGRLTATRLYRGSMRKAARKMIEDFLKGVSLNSPRVFLLNSFGLDHEIKAMAEKSIRESNCKHMGWLQPGCVVSVHCGPGGLGIVSLSSV